MPTARKSSKAQPVEVIPCPRCDSDDTKFSCYNGRGRTKPKHYCNACRRYWILGATLRQSKRAWRASGKVPSSEAQATGTGPGIPPCSSGYDASAAGGGAPAARSEMGSAPRARGAPCVVEFPEVVKWEVLEPPELCAASHLCSHAAAVSNVGGVAVPPVTGSAAVGPSMGGDGLEGSLGSGFLDWIDSFLETQMQEEFKATFWGGSACGEADNYARPPSPSYGGGELEHKLQQQQLLEQHPSLFVADRKGLGSGSQGPN